MAYERNPDDPYRSYLADARLDNELQPDPELAEAPASGAKIAMFAIAIAVVLGAVFYGLNNSTINQAGTSSTAQNTTQSPPPATRDVAPRANTDQGITTGTAPARPQTPPATAPAQMNPPANTAPASK